MGTGDLPIDWAEIGKARQVMDLEAVWRVAHRI